MLKLKFILALFFLFSNWITFSQEITGIVYSENKIPLSDVNIKIRGQSKGTKSDQKIDFWEKDRYGYTNIITNNTENCYGRTNPKSSFVINR